MSELTSQDLEAIEEVHNRWIKEELSGESSNIIELCTDDVTWMPPNEPPLLGKKAIAQYLSDSTVDLKDVQAGDVVIRGSGSVAYLTSNYRCRFMDEGGSEIQETTGTHLWILRKIGNGDWRIVIVTWSSPGRG